MLPIFLSLTVTHLSSRGRRREEERAKEDKERVGEELYIWARFSWFCLQERHDYIILLRDCLYYLVFWKSATSSGVRVMERKGMGWRFKTRPHRQLVGWPSAPNSLLWISGSSSIKQRMSSEGRDLYEHRYLIIIQLRTRKFFPKKSIMNREWK